MVYKVNVPQSSDFISQSQLDFIGNYEDVFDIWGKPNFDNVGDHIPLNYADEDYRGKHRKITFVEQSSAPSTAANEMALYTKDVGGTPQIWWREPSDGGEHQLTGGTGEGRGLVQGGIVLAAFVCFDSQGNILSTKRVNGDGEEIDVPLSANVSSVAPNQALVDGRNIYSDWNINFTTNLPTDDYIWVVQSFNDNESTILTNLVVQAQPYNSATYSDTVSTSRFRLVGFNVESDSRTISPASPCIGRLQRILFQAYVVV